MIGQHIGVEFLVPVALERLVENPFEQGDFHPGDLLGAVLRLHGEYRHTHFAECRVAISIAQSAVLAIDAVMPDIRAFQALPRPVCGGTLNEPLPPSANKQPKDCTAPAHGPIISED